MDDFDEQLKRMKRFQTGASFFIPVVALFGFAMTGGILLFIGWVIVKLLGYFGVI